MADIQEIQEYLWKNFIFHNYSLTKEKKQKQIAMCAWSSGTVLQSPAWPSFYWTVWIFPLCICPEAYIYVYFETNLYLVKAEKHCSMMLTSHRLRNVLVVSLDQTVPVGGVQVCQEYLQVELQTLPPLLQDFGNPVSYMFRRDLRWLYALL